MSAAPDIFLSYNREDAATAKLYADAFAAAGLEVWWDATLRSGEAYDQVTEEALETAKAVVVLWSPRSVVSRWVRAEATIADRNGALMPVTIEACKRPVMFELTQTADLSHWRGDAGDPAWLAFLGDVRRMVGRDEIAVTVPPASVHAVATNEKSLVAMLPLAHRGTDEELEILAEDLTDDIARELARCGYFRVIAAGGLAGWHGKSIDYRQLGRELEARYLVEGKLQRSGETARLSVQLIDTGKGSTIWSNRFTGEVGEISSSPDRFPVSVASSLREQITQSELNRTLAKQGSLSGWDHALRAVALFQRQSSDSLRRLISEARSAVSQAPDLGLAHALLAAAISSSGGFDPKAVDDAARREIQHHIGRANQLDGDNSLVLMHLALAYGNIGDIEAALRLGRRAEELDPNSAETQHALGYGCFMMGSTSEAIVALRKQDQLAPHDPSRFVGQQILGVCLCLEGDPVQAEAALDRSLALNPRWFVALKWKAIAAAQQGKDEAARDAVVRLREAEPDMSLDQHIYSSLRNPRLRERSAEAVAILRRLWAETGGDG